MNYSIFVIVTIATGIMTGSLVGFALSKTRLAPTIVQIKRKIGTTGTSMSVIGLALILGSSLRSYQRGQHALAYLLLGLGVVSLIIVSAQFANEYFKKAETQSA